MFFYVKGKMFSSIITKSKDLLIKFQRYSEILYGFSYFYIFYPITHLGNRLPHNYEIYEIL
jgi:hypothetical protein